jgi:hypothetical protein
MIERTVKKIQHRNKFKRLSKNFDIIESVTSSAFTTINRDAIQFNVSLVSIFKMLDYTPNVGIGWDIIAQQTALVH